MLTYTLLDLFFMLLHPAVIVFNLFGWIPKKTRRANLILLGLTGASWFILGIWKGIGYCPLTDWHYEVLRELGQTDLPNSYVAYLMQHTLGFRLSDQATDFLTVGLYSMALIISITLNYREWTKKKK